MKTKRPFFSFLAAAWVLPFAVASPGVAKTIRVPSQQPSLQTAIDAASDRDTILVADGTYKGAANRNLKWNAQTKHLVVKSKNGPDNCIIDCQKTARAFLLVSGQDTMDVIEGFTITNGWAKTVKPSLAGGGAILCDSTSPVIRNCRLLRNVAGDTTWSLKKSYYADGGAIDVVRKGNPVIENNVIRHNYANHTGGGVHYYGGSGGILRNNIIDSNYNVGCYGGGGIALGNASKPLIVGNVISHNLAHYYWKGGYGGGIICLNANPQIISNTIVFNTTLKGDSLGEGGGIRIRGKPFPVVRNCILWGNRSKPGLENLDFQYPSWKIDVRHCAVQGGLNGIQLETQGTNINKDPLFHDANAGNFRLTDHSPCINAGSSESLQSVLPDSDLTGTPRVMDDTIDIGAFEYSPSSLVGARFSSPPFPANPLHVSGRTPRSIQFTWDSETGGSAARFEIFNIAGKRLWSRTEPSLLPGANTFLWRFANTEALASSRLIIVGHQGKKRHCRRFVLVD